MYRGKRPGPEKENWKKLRKDLHTPKRDGERICNYMAFKINPREDKSGASASGWEFPA